jgi:hypothetical protein
MELTPFSIGVHIGVYAYRFSLTRAFNSSLLTADIEINVLDQHIVGTGVNRIPRYTIMYNKLGFMV